MSKRQPYKTSALSYVFANPISLFLRLCLLERKCFLPIFIAIASKSSAYDPIHS